MADQDADTVAPGPGPGGIGPIESAEDPGAPTRIAVPQRGAGFEVDRLPAAAAGLLAAAALTVLASLVFTDHIGVFQAYDFPVSDVTQGWVGFLLLVCAGLGAARRTRTTGTAMACALAAALLIRDLTLLDPQYPTATVTEPAGFLLPAQAAALIGAALLVVEARRRAAARRGRELGSPAASPVRLWIRIALTVGGAAAVVLWLLGNLATWLTGATSFADGSRMPLTVSCCSLAQDDGRMLAGTIAGAAALAAAVLALAWLRAVRIGVGLALGVLVLMVPDLAAAVTEIFAPQDSFIGFSPLARLGSDLYGLVVTTTVHQGFYLTLAGFAVLAVTVILRAAAGWEPEPEARTRAADARRSGRGARRERGPVAVPDGGRDDEVFELGDDIDIVEF
jgi:hypothetical protein